jgi:hypothetical protein
MSSDGEQANIIEVVVEKVAETVEVDVSSVIAEVTTTDVVTEVIQQSGQPKINESSLTEDQKKLANLMYDSTKSSIQSFMADNSLTNVLKITKTVGQVIKHLENVKIDGKAPTGADKRVVAIQLGRILIKELISNDEDEILVLYDLMAEQTLEAMIDVSRVVNVAVQELATKCCPNLFELFKRSKKTAK